MVQPATLGIIAILRGRFLYWERESEKGKGGDGARLAFEEIVRARGRALVLAMDTYTSIPSPRKQAFYCPEAMA